MHLLTMHSCSITPSSYRPFIQAKGMHNGLDRTSIGQQGHDQHDELLRFAQALEHRSPASAERFFTRFAAIALPAAIMDDNRARISLASCRTHRVRAKYLRWVHWLECTFLHKHILPGTLAFFNSPPLHRLVGSYQRKMLMNFHKIIRQSVVLMPCSIPREGVHMTSTASALFPRDDRPHVRPPRRLYPRLTLRQVLLALFLSLWLLADMLGGWIFLIPQAYAAKRPSDPPAKTTFHTFLKDHNPTHAARGRFVFPSKAPAVPRGPHSHTVNMNTLLPSAEPPTMQPINQVLSTASLAGSPTSGAPLDLKSSDGRFEVQLAPGSVDLSQATVAPGLAPSGTLTLQISQVAGHFAEQMNLMGTYQLQVVDASNRPISGIRLSTPLTLLYHYQRTQIDPPDLDPDSLYLSWPGLLAAARAAKASTSGLTIPLTNDPAAQTLTGESSMLGPGPLTVGGDAQNQSPPPALLGGVEGNSGQFGLSCPLSLPPNARGFVPHLALSYTSGDPNQRNSAVSPAGVVGDGWSLPLGSITAQKYPSGSASAQTWYFLSGVGNTSDRLVPASQSGSYQTFHISHLRTHQVTSSDTGQPCFNVYDTSGTFYEFGCDSDALQFWTETNGTQHNYRWDLDKIISPNEGPSTMREYLTVSYIHDCKPCTTNKTWRDSAITQILYGQRLSDKSQDTVAGTIDFFYRAPFDHAPWTQSYGTNYNCTGTPPVSTDLRCDDPQDDGTVKKPLVMSTFSLQSLTAYVGDDSSSTHKAFSYSFAYQDRAFPVCYDPYTLIQEYCAGEHLLTSITPSVYQNGTQHQLRPVNMTYTEGDNFYIDSSQKTQDNSQQYGGQTIL